MAERRKSSRKKSSRNKTSNSNLKSKTKKNSDSVNFLSLVAGMITSLVLVSWAVAGWRPNDVDPIPVTAELDEMGLGLTDFDKIFAEGNESQLVEYLNKLNRWPKRAALPVKLDYQKKRIAIADRLLELNPPEVRRLIAVNSKIEASSSYYGLDFLHQMNLPEAKQALESAATANLNDSQENVRRSAKLALTKLRIFEYSKTNDPGDLQLAKDSVFDAIDSFPNDKYVVDNIRLLIQRVFYDNVENGRQLMTDFFEKYSDSESKKVQMLALEMNDKVLLADANYLKLIANRWADGEPGRQKLLATSLDLIGNPNCATTVLTQVSTTLGWFEQINDLESAKKIADAMIEASRKHPVPEVAAAFEKTGNAGLKRLSMVGNKIDLEVNTNKGQLSDESFDTRIVMLLFFSNDKRSTAAMNRIIASARDQYTKGIDLIAICLDEELGDDAKDLVNKHPQMKYTMSDSSSSHPILDQYPVLTAPHVVIVDHHGIVRRINVQLADIQTHLDEYVATRRRENRASNN